MVGSQYGFITENLTLSSVMAKITGVMITQEKGALCSFHKPECSKCSVIIIKSWDLIKVIMYETSSMALKIPGNYFSY